MNCSNHIDREPIAMCVRCNKLICKECTVKINNKYYCKECVSEMYSDNNNSENNMNKEKVKEYADKAVNAANDALNLVKDFSNSEEVKNIINNDKGNQMAVNYVLAIIAIILLLPKVINNLDNITNILENVYLSFRYNEVIRCFIFLINALISVIQPILLIALAVLLFNNFMKLNRKIRMIAPILILGLFTIIRFVLGNIAIRFVDISPIIDMFSYIIPVGLIVIGSYLDKE